MRNPLGNIEKKVVEVYGKKVTVWDVTKSYKWLDENGNQLYNKNGSKKYKEKFKRCYSYQEAKTALENMPAEIEREKQKEVEVKIIENKEKTFFDLCDYFEKEYVKPAVFVRGRKVVGYKKNIAHIKTIIKNQEKFFGDVPLSKITYENLRKYKEHISLHKSEKTGEYLKPASINEKLSLLRRMLNVAVQSDWLMRNPFTRGKSLINRSEEEPRTRILSFAEESRLLANCTGKQAYLRDYIIVALETGLRQSEIFNLDWRDIHLDLGLVHIRPGDEFTKTGKMGLVPITDNVREILERRKANFIYEKQPFPKKDFRKSWKTLCKNAGITDLQFRDLRSTTATRYDEGGVSESLATKILRNTPKIRQKHYIILDQENIARIGRKMSDFLKQNRIVSAES